MKSGKIIPQRSVMSVPRRTVLVGASAAAIALAFDKLGGSAAAQTPRSVKPTQAIHLGMYVSVYAAKHGGFFRSMVSMSVSFCGRYRAGIAGCPFG